ncbi:SURF1 family protein [Uliginosibacterium sp. H3]|uniref:SURF1-like protein n=1 Tax=Uliginosibacterium silvisoli TaxID=3114758 RepID=A0ABU6K2D0_9RHOO|nr:SURF1 family protein [Uliginosibacterium sp. H3]
MIVRLTPYVAGVLMCVLCVRLGFWQVHRAEYKAERQAHLDAAGAPLPAKSAATLEEWQRVALSGTWIAPQTVFLDNRVREKQTGYHVLTPLRLDGGGGVVIVNRGWVAAGLLRSNLPVITTPAGHVTLNGLMLKPDLTGFRLDDGKEAGAVWQRADPAHFATRLGEKVSSLILFQESDGHDALLRDWPRPDLGVGKHKAYALQWFVFAVTAAGLTGFFGWRQWRRSPRKKA